SGSTYYSFVDSGTFTVQYASFTFMDENGIQLSNNGPFSINDSTFDNGGSLAGVSTGTLFTLNGVTQSTVTLTNVAYGNSGTASFKYNYAIYGSSTGLFWQNNSYVGSLGGDAHEFNDTSNLIRWTLPVSVLYTWWGSVSTDWTVGGNWNPTGPP